MITRTRSPTICRNIFGNQKKYEEAKVQNWSIEASERRRILASQERFCSRVGINYKYCCMQQDSVLKRDQFERLTYTCFLRRTASYLAMECNLPETDKQTSINNKSWMNSESLLVKLFTISINLILPDCMLAPKFWINCELIADSSNLVGYTQDTNNMLLQYVS
jgi:hypothetical protein